MSAKTDSDIRLGLIGAGRWGRVYIKTLQETAGVTLVHLASRNPESASWAGPSCKISPDWRDVIAASDLDGVVIATPPHVHAEIAGAAIRQGIPVLIEKPLTLDVVSARELLALAENHDSIVLVDHVHLFHPAYREMKRRIADLGPIREIESVGESWGPFRKNVPVLWDWGAHDMSLCLDYLNDVPTSLSASLVEARNVESGLGQKIRISLGFPKGITATISIGNTFAEKRRSFTVTGHRCQFIYDGLNPAPLSIKPFDNESELQAQSHGFPVAVSSELPLTGAVREFLRMIRSRDSSLSL